MTPIDKTAPSQTESISFEFDLRHLPEKVWRALRLEDDGREARRPAREDPMSRSRISSICRGEQFPVRRETRQVT